MRNGGFFSAKKVEQIYDLFIDTYKSNNIGVNEIGLRVNDQRNEYELKQGSLVNTGDIS